MMSRVSESVPDLSALLGLVESGLDPENPGWFKWSPLRVGLFADVLGPLIVRSEGPGRARVRMPTLRPSHLNMANVLHGGLLLTFADVAIFCGAFFAGLEKRALGGQTLQLDMKFMAAGIIGTPLDALVEVVRETNSTVFLRADLIQGMDRRAIVSAIMRKSRVSTTDAAEAVRPT